MSGMPLILNFYLFSSWQEATLGCRAAAGVTAGHWVAWSASTPLTSTGPPCRPCTRPAAGWGSQCWRAWSMWSEVRELRMFVFKLTLKRISAILRLFFSLSPGEKDSMIFDCTERYDPVTKQWAAVASLNFPRCGVGVCPCHGALYALGKFHSCTVFNQKTYSTNW